MKLCDIIIFICILIIIYFIYKNIDKFVNTPSLSTQNSNEQEHVVINTPAKNTLWGIVRWIL